MSGATELDRLVRAALDEDAAFNDVTTLAIVPADHTSTFVMRARGAGVVAGVECAVSAFRQLDPSVAIAVAADDGAVVGPGDVIMTLTGATRGLLSAERVALNFVQRLSGVATLTAQYVAAVRGMRARILDTRKTTPGWRVLEKAAVRAGGGANHRMDLQSMALVKDNHICAAGGDIRAAVARVRAHIPAGVEIEVEADTLEQAAAAAEAGADRILLDNMTPASLRAAVLAIAGRARSEASGGVTLANVRAIADTGVDDISVGALTHSAPALDIGLDQ